ncbi:hypothetical protein POSPLADRAFT_1034380 [Postia placenta MAD-698-R-SB12]|uniref:Uncharacterized protein n=1 Tax=Postia placenta MAD-698-R-SB12 TaxID=670580 RepID=A0A1X6N089_9APHY|nr:hypothetical protein POSPLADRAFT_1034380 [Postia placenta MAD-698-R-SB12]OSX61896.1 hypothetical protein POSPLADRAFT_1034380 [Postia placenta MAD-698-R-SB12]
MGFLHRLKSTPAPDPSTAPRATPKRLSTPKNALVHADSVACIAYFPAAPSTELSPRLGMNLDVRFIRPGRPGTALAIPLSSSLSFSNLPPRHAPPPYAQKETRPTHAQKETRPTHAQKETRPTHARAESLPTAFPAPPLSCPHLVLPALDELLVDAPAPQPHVRARVVAALQRLARRPPRAHAHADAEQRFQDAQHAMHRCWRCRRAGGRRPACRAFRHPPAETELFA